MSNQKHTVATDALETLGTLIDDKAGRDAIHLAVEPSVAAERLYPGQHVGFVEGGIGANVGKTVGIVDPFLIGPVYPGQHFWLIVYPRQITSLRHVWTHPAFDEANPVAAVPDKSASEQWLRDFCAASDCPGYEDVMKVIVSDNGVQLGDSEYYGKSRVDGDAIFFSGLDAHGDIPDEFWDHVEVVTGKKVRHRASYFSCSC